MLNLRNLGRSLAILICLGALLAPSAAFADEGQKGEGEPEGESLTDVVIQLDAAIYSKNVWRGLLKTDDPVLQAAASVSFFGFSARFWGNLDLTDENDKEYEFSEVDGILSYGLKLGPVELEGGLISYYYPDGDGDTAEIYLSGGLDILLSPKLSIYKDIDEIDGIYGALSLAYSFGFIGKAVGVVGLDPQLTGSLGYGDWKHNEAYYGVRDDGFADLTLGLTVPWTLLDTVTVFAGVYYSTLVDSDLRDAVRDSSNTWFGIGASLKF